MWVDLPPGTWTAALIGPWWPAPSTALRAGAQYWSEACAEQQLYSQTLRGQWTLFAAHNQGHTADDLIDRFQRGEKFHLDLAEKYQAKASAFNSAADATDYARSRLSDIATTGNNEINNILASNKPLPAKLAEIQAVQMRCNADAGNASRDSVDKMMAATQKILDLDGVGGDARSWARANGFDVGDAQAPKPISERDLGSASHGVGVPTVAAAARMQLELRHRSQGWAPPIEEAAELTQRASTALADTNPWRRQVPTIEGAVCRPKVGLRPRRLPPRGTCLVAAEPYLQDARCSGRRYVHVTSRPRPRRSTQPGSVLHIRLRHRPSDRPWWTSAFGRTAKCIRWRSTSNAACNTGRHTHRAQRRSVHCSNASR